MANQATEHQLAVWRADPGKWSVVTAVVRRLVPYMVEATLIPTVLFYAGLVTFGLTSGVVAAVAWTYIAVARRLVHGRVVPGLLIVAAVGISVRAGAYLLSGSAFVYFFQPVLRTVATSLLFAISVVAGRPLVARFADDFCLIGSDVHSRPAIVSLFRRLTYLWAGTQAIVAIANLALLLTVPIAVFVGTATAIAWAVTCAGVVITVFDSVRTARADGLGTALADRGRLHAYVHA